MIYTVTLNPALDKSVEIPGFTPNAVNRAASVRVDPGGKGINVSKALARLGADSLAFAVLGGDTGRAVAAGLKRLGLRCEILWTEGETRTNLKIVDPESGSTTDVNEPGEPIPAGGLSGLLGQLTGLLKPSDLAVLSGSLPPGAPKDMYRVLTQTCRARGARVLLDADGAPLAEGLKAAPSLIKPNEAEFARLTGTAPDSPGGLADAARGLLRRYQIPRIVVTLGGRGALYANEGQAFFASAPRVSVRSATGAGDGVVAALAFAMQEKKPWPEAFRFAVAYGSACAACPGSAPARRADAEALAPQVRLEAV